MQDNATSVGEGSATPPMSARSQSASFRRLYARAADPEAFIPGGEVIDVVSAAMPSAAIDIERPLDALIEDVVVWSRSASDRFRAVADLAHRDDHRRLIRRAVLGCAPLGLVAGAWLQWLSSPGNADAPSTLRILALYASDVGAGHPGAARRDAYLDLLRQLRASENAVPLARLTADPRIPDGAFRLPSLLLLMSRRPSDFCPELIGADLCLRAVGLPPPLVWAAGELSADWAAIDYSDARGDGPSSAQRCHAIAETLIREDPESAARVYAGFGWTSAALRTQVDALLGQLQASLNPAYDMAEMISLRAREGRLYHQDVMLGGRPLTEWLTECQTDARPFLDVLAQSNLVKPGRSRSSRLIGWLVSERGPMFRVFSPDDLAVIRRWIDALPTGPVPTEPVPTGTVEPDDAAATRVRGTGQASDREPLTMLPALLDAPSPPGAAPNDLREAYHLLMTRTWSPRLHEWSLRYVREWLARSRHRMGPRSVPLPTAWTVEGLRPWLRSQHERHGTEFTDTADAPLPSREAVVDDAVQLAPLTLIDGSWLQGFTDYELASSPIGHSLFAIYWDELGNGEPKLNHPRIYRDVLKQMDVDLPPTSSPEFVRWPGFRDASFELPVYWLCIGRFPRTFLPEVLGLNVAMELSGVGGAYRRAGLALRSHGFSTRFVDIHNTIDNVATGHSAWATDAVDTLMADLSDSDGHGGRAEVWERVRTGYRSLNPPGGLLARRAARFRSSRKSPAAEQ